MKSIISGLVLLLGFTIYTYSQQVKLKEEYTFMFYNTENLYDAANDSLKQDEEFTPEGMRRWSKGRLYRKANRIAKVILAAGAWEAPVFVGLCEVEDREVLEKLTRQTPLSKYRYQIIHKDSPDPRGIDVAFIYRPELFKPFEYKSIALKDTSNTTFSSRDILRVSGVLNNWDTLHVFVNHWPSRYGGVMETMRYRKLAAEMLAQSIHELFVKYPRAKIICLGDFNDTPDDESLTGVLKAAKINHPEIKGEMVNLSAEWMTQPVQTIKSQYTWQVFDQCIISDFLLENTIGINIISAEIFKAPFLLEADAKYGGVKPKRTYVGFKYQEGFSDHLPILLKCRMSN